MVHILVLRNRRASLVRPEFLLKKESPPPESADKPLPLVLLCNNTSIHTEMLIIIIIEPPIISKMLMSITIKQSFLLTADSAALTAQKTKSLQF